MQLDSLSIAWFRGAADGTVFEPAGKSFVVYGANGSGKSALVDAIEYAVTGRLEHLAHEYSGKRQEKGLINTHIPKGKNATIGLDFGGGRVLCISIKKDGTHTAKGSTPGLVDTIQQWDVSRFVLRQDQLSNFIHARKGEKYSSLLPLLGLQELENLALNLKELAASVADVGKLYVKLAKKSQIDQERERVFPGMTNEQIEDRLRSKYKTYKGEVCPMDLSDAATELSAAIESQISSMQSIQAGHIAVKTVSNCSCDAKFGIYCKKSNAAAELAQPLLDERLAIIKGAARYAQDIREDEEMICPACGQKIRAASFQSHIISEMNNLQNAISAFEGRDSALEDLSDAIRRTVDELGKPDLSVWLAEPRQKQLRDCYESLQTLNTKELRRHCTVEQFATIEQTVPKLAELIKGYVKHVPPGVGTLIDDKGAADVVVSHCQTAKLTEEITLIQRLVGLIESCQNQTRAEIKAQTKAIIKVISADVREMWSILHPKEPIEEIALYVPLDTDKAIDVGLKFHDVQQDSPRLTLSEGHRNSLGLCIFLAIAKSDCDSSKPLILDDVVSSLDRDHRALVADLLAREFPKRQILVFTHDREWFAELNRLLPSSVWQFRCHCSGI